MKPRQIGVVSSPLTDPAAAAKQGDEGAPEAWVELEEAFAPGLEGVGPGLEMLVLTWLDRAPRSRL